ncbi:MAG: D-aminoacyl-tRNA deacylase [Candidatus Paceibacterota bacterium]
MKAIIQRVNQAQVTTEERTLGKISKGMVVLLGVGQEDKQQTVEKLAEEISNLRIFSSADKNIDRSVRDIEGEILIVPQFTLYADTSKGNRPSFMKAADPEKAKQLYLNFVDYLKDNSRLKIATGEFGAMMDVSLVNDGPVTIILEE